MLTEILIGGVAGLVYGAAIGYVKYVALWKRTIKNKASISMSAVYRRMAISYVVNFVALLFVFLVRNMLPIDFMWPLIGAAISLSVSARFAPMHEVMKHVKPGNKTEEGNE